MKIRLVSYNIHRAIGVDRRFRPDRIVRILEEHRPDIALLQEVDEGVPRSRELDMAKEIAHEAGFPYYAVGHNVSLRKGKYGNATLSRFPIERERNIDLTIDGRKRRGCQHTTLRAEAVAGHPHRLEVFNLHLGLSMRERQQQVGRLVRSGEFRELDEDVPCILGGDFNDWRSLLRFFFIEAFAFPLRHGSTGEARTAGDRHLSVTLAPGRARQGLLPRSAAATQGRALPAPGRPCRQ